MNEILYSIIIWWGACEQGLGGKVHTHTPTETTRKSSSVRWSRMNSSEAGGPACLIGAATGGHERDIKRYVLVIVNWDL